MIAFFKRLFIIIAIMMALSCLCAKYGSFVASDFDYDVSTGAPLK